MSISVPTPEHILEMLLQSAISQTFAAGSVLIEDGRQSDAVYYLVKGKVAIVKDNLEVSIQTDGCMLGEMGVLMGKPRSASVVCVTEAETLRVEAADFVSVLEEYPMFLRAIFSDVVTKLQATRMPGAVVEELVDDSWTNDVRHIGTETTLKILVKRQQAAQRPCWHRIGVWGDGSCPELTSAIHCRNCPVFADGGRSLLERRPARDYIQQWTAVLAQPKEMLEKEVESVVIFRLGDEWLAMRAQIFQEITHQRPIHWLPHRSNEVLLGMISVRGELLLCFSLANLLGVAKGDGSARVLTQRVYQRLAVTGKEGQRWVFPVDEVLGIHKLPKRAVQNTPATLAKASASFASGVFTHRDTSVELLDDELVFYNLEKNYL